MVPLASQERTTKSSSSAVRNDGGHGMTRYRFVEQPELPPSNGATPVPILPLQASSEGNEPPPQGVDVSSLAFPPTDNPRPSFFVCGRNSGVMSLYSLSALDRAETDLGFSLSLQTRFSTAINDIAFTGDGLRMAVALEDGTVRLLDTSTLREVDNLPVKSDAACTCACFSPQSNLLVVGTFAGSLHAHDARIPRHLVRTLSPAHASPVSAVAFHPDGTAFLSAGLDGLARVWDATGPCLATLIGSSDRGLGSGVFSPNGRYAFLSALDDGGLGLWDLAHSGRLKRVRKYPRVNTKYWMRAVFTESGAVVGGSEDGKLLAWDTSTTQVVAEWNCGDKTDAKGTVKIPLACAASKSYVAYGGIGCADPHIVKLVPQ